MDVRNDRSRGSASLRMAVHAALAASALAASAVVAPQAEAAPPGCTVTGTTSLTATCTGDQSAGMSYGFAEFDSFISPLYLTELDSVYINPGALTTNIAPVPGAPGISIIGATPSPGYFWLQMFDSARTVTTTGDGAVGLSVRNLGSNLSNYWAGSAFLFNHSQVSTNGRNANVLTAESGVDVNQFNFGGHSTNAGFGGAAEVVNTANLYSFSTALDAHSHGIFAHSYSIYSQVGGFVYVQSDAQQITTLGGGSNGIFGLSEGGFGESGDSGAGSGDSGNRGGDGGTVQMYGSGNINTYGAGADGILAISRGGKGGNGGNGTFGGGGGGAFGGRAGAVLVDGSWNIATVGPNSSGIFAESLGGEGGSGGNSNIGIGDGGTGGGSGDGYTVNVHSRGHITTQGAFSYGIFAHSVGGFAGGGGNAYGIVAYGGSSQSAGYADHVEVTNEGEIDTIGISAHAIVAQSVGGGGGAGGNGGAIVAVGGAGNAGGDGGRVDVHNYGRLVAAGVDARGIFAQSIGGGGGDGGDAGGVGAIGGSGSGTSNSNEVHVDNHAQISSRAQAIYAESIGGGGGNGGSSTGWFSIGGGGGAGGDSKLVDVKNYAGLSTTQDDSSAIFAHSVGGGGGNGGGSFSAGPVVSVAVGGKGAVAGDGGEVTVHSEGGDITTVGARSSGIYAQSIGGGGGNGGYAVSAAASPGGAAALAVGGDAAEGGSSKHVTVENANSIETLGTESSAIFAQSIGGGGGNGGFAISMAAGEGFAGGASVGGKGGGGGDGEEVTVTSTGQTLETSGDRAYGLLAQSIGGGGGNGGFAISGTFTTEGVAAAFALGGAGDHGGIAKDVTVDSTSNIMTRGSDAHGLFAQSLGGGGGSGGFAIAGSISGGGAADFALGGSGAGGGGSADVTVGKTQATSGVIHTFGANSDGLLAQSIGGGGGNGGFAVAGSITLSSSAQLAIGGHAGAGSNASNVVVNAGNTIFTEGDDSHGLFAQSLGGGGGNGGFAVTGSIGFNGGSVGVAIGGGGSGGGDAGTVSVDSTGQVIATRGEHSYGLTAQSVGGGGGDGGFAVTGSIAFNGTGTGLAIGGNGDHGGAAKTVTVESSTSIFTLGNDSHALVAQSLGGGGGSGGFAISGSISFTAAANFALGGKGSGGGDAGEVHVGLENATTGDIMTAGNTSVGLLAQSIGGGGGSGGFAVAGSITQSGSAQLGIGGSGGTGSDAAEVTVNAANSIYTAGNDSHGIFAQSAGGGGGNGGFAVTGSITFNGGSVGASIGGSGAGGGDAGDVRVASAGQQIVTRGTHSYGVAAESVGGGGGDGGFSVTGDIASGPSAGLAIGGSGDHGGIGKDVHLDSSTTIETFGNESHGIFAESLGGGGGSGGFAVAGSISQSGAADFSLGGKGLGGGIAGQVIVGEDVATTGVIRTHGDTAYGLLAQSIGGGGGNGGFSVAGDITESGSAQLAIGGHGGQGGNAGFVSVNAANSIVTEGANSHGLFAQSLGGGGGNGGFAVAGSITTSGSNVGASIGGGGDGGGDAQNVVVTSAGQEIETFGSHAFGLVAQSVGGGGGDGGFAVTGGISSGAAATLSMGGNGAHGGVGHDVTVHSSTSIFTFGDDSHGLFAQSLGGGGGSGGFSISGSVSFESGTLGASIGGNGGPGGNANTVTVGTDDAPTSGNITTQGDRSYGLVAQSVGGGGGDGGFSIAGGITKGAGVKLSLGGNGDYGGNGGVVNVATASSIGTRGDESHGIFAQSVGGGGGSGGFSVAGSISSDQGSLNASIGGFGDGGGNASSVSVASSGTQIATEGDGAHGIFAQSLGGGGGDGGFSVAGSVTKKSSVNLSLGGFGDGGGDSSAVTVLSSTSIATIGVGSHAIFAQSLGGGGGNGGFSVAGSLFSTDTSNPSIDASVGGFGGGGGKSGEVHVGTDDDAVTGVLQTSGVGSYGIFAQSVGGGGGNGGFSIAGGVNKSPSVNFSVGGFGAGGGDGAFVGVNSDASIYTLGDNSHALFAQSIGGGGGNGGFSVAASASAPSGKGKARIGVDAAAGGDGAGGGIGGDVNVANAGELIYTGGKNAYGIFAQSIGGAGGNGGFAFAGALSVPTGGAGARDVDFAIGGWGGNGNIGGDVGVTNDGTIHTVGDGSHAILAHSIGGGGGNGGFAASGSLNALASQSQSRTASIAVSIGGFGGTGNLGGAVSVTNTGELQTLGASSRAIYAYSTGGGGGNGGASYSIDTDVGQSNKGNAVNLEVSVGGFGGTGNVSGAVAVTNEGRIVTDGLESDAIFAESIGGGGGSGGDSHAVSFDFTRTNQADAPAKEGSQWNVTASVGGNAGSGEDGNTVDVTNNGDIVTLGTYARGILARSIGGGGGSGGNGISGTGIDGIDAGSDLLDLKDKNVIDLRNWSLTIGGNGGESGDGKAVHVTNTGMVLTQGLSSSAIVAQSIGGGGGEAMNFVEVTEAQAGAGQGGTASSGINSKFAIGGGGGSAGNGGDVTVTNAGYLQTEGDDAYGIFAQSIGGGGGVAGSVARGLSSAFGPLPALNIGIGLAFGQDGGSGGDGGVVLVNNTSNIMTLGTQSYGIFAQSVAGGGGAAGGLGNENTFAAPVLRLQNFYGSSGGSGDAKSVTVNQTGDITAQGDTSAAIFAQSIASHGTGGAVNVTTNGNILAFGANSIGILAQSIGLDGSGAIAIHVDGGAVNGGTGSIGSGIAFLGGTQNSLVNHGTIGDIAALEATIVTSGAEIKTTDDAPEITAGGGALTIDNYSGIAGKLDLRGTTNAFVNHANALFVSGTSENLGAGTLTNSGTWAPGYFDQFMTTQMTGNLVQTATGVLAYDYNSTTGASDRVNLAAGNTAALSGGVALNLLNVATLAPGTHTTVLMTVPGGISMSNLDLLVQQSAVTSYRLTTTATDLVLTSSTDFAPAALTANQRAVGQYLNQVQLAGSTAGLARTIETIAALPDNAHLNSYYDHLTPDTFLSEQVTPFFDNARFSDALLSCRQLDGEYRYTDEGQCFWMGTTRSERRQDAAEGAVGFNQDTTSLAAGIQFEISPHWHVGFGATADGTTLQASRIDSHHAVQRAEGDGQMLGTVLKANFGGNTFSASFTGGWSSYDSKRDSLVATNSPTATASQDLSVAAMHFRYGYAIERPEWYARALLDAGYTWIHRDAFTEAGSDATNLDVHAANLGVGSLQPALELGREFVFTGGTHMRLYARGGYTRVLSGDKTNLVASFVGAPSTVTPFSVSQSWDRAYTDLTGGLDLISSKGYVFRFSYTDSTSDRAKTRAGTVKLSVPF